MPRYEGKVFTYAVNSAYRNVPELLFSNLPTYEIKNIDSKELENIIQNPLVTEALGSYCAAIPNSEFIVFTTDTYGRFAQLLDNADMSDVCVTLREHNTIHSFKIAEVYNNCYLPEKYILGCKQCLRHQDTAYQCPLKQFLSVMDRVPRPYPGDIEDIKDTWTPRKTKIGDYTLISPILTSHRPIDRTLRPTHQHDFGYVAGNSDIRQSAAKERIRIQQFKQQACMNCFVREKCWQEYAYRRGGRTGWGVKQCCGEYQGSQDKTAKEILRNVKIPYTNAQLSFLLQNTGQLDHRLYKKKWWATLDIADKQLVFSLRRTTKPYSHNAIRFESFEEAKDVLERCNDHVFPAKDYKFSAIQKATLVELLERDYSPTHRGGWRSTRYPLLGVRWDEYRQTFSASYRYMHACCTLRWHTEVKDLTDIYQHYETFINARKSHNPLGNNRGWRD